MNNMRGIACDIKARLRFVKSQIIILPSEMDDNGNILIKYDDNISLNDINLILPCQKALFERECSICLESIKKDDHIRILNCTHTYHVNCIDTWLVNNPRCPECRFHCANTQNLPTSCTEHTPPN